MNTVRKRLVGGGSTGKCLASTLSQKLALKTLTLYTHPHELKKMHSNLISFQSPPLRAAFIRFRLLVEEQITTMHEQIHPKRLEFSLPEFLQQLGAKNWNNFALELYQHRNLKGRALPLLSSSPYPLMRVFHASHHDHRLKVRLLLF